MLPKDGRFSARNTWRAPQGARSGIVCRFSGKMESERSTGDWSREKHRPSSPGDGMNRRGILRSPSMTCFIRTVRCWCPKRRKCSALLPEIPEERKDAGGKSPASAWNGQEHSFSGHAFCCGTGHSTFDLERRTAFFRFPLPEKEHSRFSSSKNRGNGGEAPPAVFFQRQEGSKQTFSQTTRPSGQRQCSVPLFFKGNIT